MLVGVFCVTYALRVQKKLSSKNGCVLREVCAESKENVDRKEYVT